MNPPGPPERADDGRAAAEPRCPVRRIFLVTYRYDLPNLAVCLASIRYWHPDVEITIILNENRGPVDFRFLAARYKVTFTHASRYRYGTFYGSLEPYLSGSGERFLCLDTDTALTGPILDTLAGWPEDFVVDREEQPPEKLRALYWDPARIGHYVSSYTPDWFTFNNGIICGRGDRITGADFADFMVWRDDSPPVMKDAAAFPMADMSAINVVLNKKFAGGQLGLRRAPLMIYPPDFRGSEADLLRGIAGRTGTEARVIHWADQKQQPLRVRPLGGVYRFYYGRFLADFSAFERLRIRLRIAFLAAERALRDFTARAVRAIRVRLCGGYGRAGRSS